MGPRVCVTPPEFLRLIGEHRGLVIQGRKNVFQGITYVSRCGDYFYYTISKVPLRLPRDCEVQQARTVLL